MEQYIDEFGLIRPAVKCCNRIMEYVGYTDEPIFSYVHRCSCCGRIRYVEENHYDFLCNILNNQMNIQSVTF